MSYIYNQTSQKGLRRKLRKNQPATERILWSKLRNRQLLGFKFRRQYGIGHFVVDCCCVEAKVAIELDGDTHYINLEAKGKDKERQKHIEDLGFKVLRSTNKEINENLEGVLEVIAKHLKILPHLSSPLQGEESD